MISEAQLSRLLDVALTAAHRGLAADSRAMLEGLLAYKPGHAPALIGLAFTHVVVNDFDPAIDMLRRDVLDKNPGDQEALAILGLALKLAGRQGEAEEILAGLKTGADGVAAELAAALTA